MNSSDLETKANAIEAVMERYNIPVRVEGGMVAPRSITFTLSRPLPKDAQLESDLAQALQVADVALVGRTITVKRSDTCPVELLPLLYNLTRPAAKPLPPCTATLGLCDDGAPLLIRLSSDQVGHVLVTGHDERSTASLLQTIATSLSVMNRPRALWMVLIGQAFSSLAYLPHVLSLITDDERANTEMGSLARLLGRDNPAPRIAVLINGLNTVVSDGNLARLLKDGHTSGIHIVASGSVGLSSAGFKTLIHGKDEVGDFEVMDGGQLVRFTAATITSKEVNQVVTAGVPGSSGASLNNT